jgi:hypothetical protein
VFVGIHRCAYLQVRAMIESEAVSLDVQKFAQLAANLAARPRPVPRCPGGLQQPADQRRGGDVGLGGLPAQMRVELAVDAPCMDDR